MSRWRDPTSVLFKTTRSSAARSPAICARIGIVARTLSRRGTSSTARSPEFPEAIPAGIPLEMLERRPDMIAADRRVAAAFNRVGEAKAARLPRIVLNANVAVIESAILQLQEDFENPTAGVGARLLAPLYQGGALNTRSRFAPLSRKKRLRITPAWPCALSAKWRAPRRRPLARGTQRTSSTHSGRQ